MPIPMLSPLRHRDFRLLWIGQSVSMLGNSLYSVALPFQIIMLGGSPIQLGVGLAIFSAAQLATVLFGGAIVDRLPRRRVILATDLSSGLVVGIVATLGITRNLEIWQIYLASAFFGLAFAFYFPAMSAIMPELVPKEILIAGNSLRSLSGQGARVLGPLLGGAIVAVAGPSTAFALDAATFIFSFFVFVFSHSPEREPLPPKRLLSQVREGLAYTLSMNWIWITIAGFAFSNAFYLASFSVALPLLVLKVLNGSAATFGLIGAVGGVGSIAGALFVGNLRVRRLGPAMYIGNSVIGVALLGYGLAPYLPIVLFSAFLFSATLIGANTLWESAVQKYVPGDLIGRVSSVDSFGSWLVGPVAPIIAGVLVQQTGPRAIFIVGGIASIAFWLVALFISRSVQTL